MTTKPISKMNHQEYRKYCDEKAYRKERAFDNIQYHLLNGFTILPVQKRSIVLSEASDFFGVIGRKGDFLILILNHKTDSYFYGHLILDDGTVIRDIGIELLQDDRMRIH